MRRSRFHRSRKYQKVKIRRTVNLHLKVNQSLDKRVNAIAGKYEKSPTVKPTGYPIPTYGRKKEKVKQ